MQKVETAPSQLLFQHAVARLAGREVARDVPEARRLLRQAAELGSEDAALLEVALTANGSGGPASWVDALHLLRSAAETSATARAHLDLVGRMSIDSEGRPLCLPEARRICDRPDAQLFPSLLSPAECDHVVATAADLLRPAVVVDPATGREIAHPIRRSDAAIIGPVREDLVIGAINRRIAAASGTDVEQGEPLAILRYGPGQEYRSHLDVLPNEANQRVATVIVYLNGGYLGGRTRFDARRIEVRGRRGDALVFRNVLPGGGVDPASQHAGLPVWRGQKLIATRWIRQRRLDLWAGRS